MDFYCVECDELVNFRESYGWSKKIWTCPHCGYEYDTNMMSDLQMDMREAQIESMIDY